MEKPKCTNPNCFEGTIEVQNGAETSTEVCPVCKGTGYVPNAIECEFEGCVNGKIEQTEPGEVDFKTETIGDIEVFETNCPKCHGKGWYILQEPTQVNSKISLSICMIVGKEEGNLQRCLDSILPLTYQDWCELIIICTQEGDRTQQIAEKYADIVEFQKWEADFSKHRNYGINLASGRKIFIIDADEQLEQDSLYLLQDMILNPEYSEFGTMFMNVINILSIDKIKRSVVQQARIFDNPEGKPLYTGAAHNKPQPTEPYFIANDVNLLHFGYMFEGKQYLKKEKMNRTLPILLREYKKDNNNLQMLTHIIKTYHTERDHKNVMAYSNKWIKMMRDVKKKGEFNDGWFAYLEIFNILVASCVTNNEIKRALKFKKIADEFSDRLPMIHFHIGYWYATKEKREDAVKWIEQGVKIANKTAGKMEGLLASHVDMIIDEIFVWLTVYYFEKGDYDKAGKYMNAGVHNSQHPERIRWDIWNEENCKKRLIT